MKKFRKFGGLIMVMLALAFFFTNCEKEKDLPIADFTYEPTTIIVGATVTFTNTTQKGNTYLWDFGDGGTSAEKSPTYTYTTAGTYKVKLTATNTDGDNSTEKTLLVSEVALELPTASFTYDPAVIIAGTIVTFTNTTVNGDTYLWDFGDSVTSTEESPTYTYSAAGTFVVKLTATNSDGDNSAEKTLEVGEAAGDLPIASFTYEPATIIVGDTVSFTNTTVDGDSYLWDFGDGATSTETNPTHQFATAAEVVVKLTATNSVGSNVAEQTITIDDLANYYSIDDTTYIITTDFFWYSGFGGDPYLRLLTDVAGQDNPDLVKLYPNKGLGDLAQTYTWSDGGNAGTYNHGYTANYAGMDYDWTAIGKTGSSDLVIEEVETDVYKITGEMILSIGTWDFGTGEFTETSAATLIIYYVGSITPL